MNKGTSKKRTGVLLLTACAALLGASALASAEVAKQGPIIVAFHGNIAPRKLPRQVPAPVAVRLGGRIKSTDRENSPILDRIVLDINRHGKIQSKGLPTCQFGRLKSISSAAAKRTCRNALVGHGNVTSRVSLPGQGAFATNGPLLAFNGRYKGRPAILAQVATGAPLPLTYVIPFEIRNSSKGTFGTRLIGTVPEIASEYGYISAFDLSLGATYRYHGKKMSYASASCPAPKGFTAAVFPFAKASYEFAGGPTLSAQLVRECRVKR